MARRGVRVSAFAMPTADRQGSTGFAKASPRQGFLKTLSRLPNVLSTVDLLANEIEMKESLLGLGIIDDSRQQSI
jgi:hypothetical protein